MTTLIGAFLTASAAIGASILIAAPVNADPCICQMGKPCQTSHGLPCSPGHRDDVPGAGSPNGNGPEATTTTTTTTEPSVVGPMVLLAVTSCLGNY
jgi:hypothetical protein